MSSFEWDGLKNRINIIKHGVSFDIAQLAFLDSKIVIAKYTSHSQKEQRFYCFGKVDHKVLTVRFTLRNGKIRIIGAGYWRRGKNIYEKENKI